MFGPLLGMTGFVIKVTFALGQKPQCLQPARYHMTEENSISMSNGLTRRETISDLKRPATLLFRGKAGIGYITYSMMQFVLYHHFS